MAIRAVVQLGGSLMAATKQTEDPALGDDRPSEDDIQREKLGPRGVPGAPDPAKMTPQRQKKTPKHIDPGHTA